jgi:hypothetical protein
MQSPRKDDPDTWPKLGRMYSWVDKPGSADRIFYGLIVVCVLLFLADFTYEKHPHYAVEYVPGFFGIFGFIGFTGLIFAATALRKIVKRPEDYYGNKAVDGEEYPDAGLDKVENDA